MKEKLKIICFDGEIDNKKISIKTEWKIVPLKDSWYEFYKSQKPREINIWNFNDFLIQNYMVSWDLEDIKLNKRNINSLSATIAFALIEGYKKSMEELYGE
jgi:hypothetical protein